MTDYKEIMRLRSLKLNHSQITESAAASRPTVIGVLQRAQALELDWKIAESLSDRELAEKLNPSSGGKPTYKMPDYEYVHGSLRSRG